MSVRPGLPSWRYNTDHIWLYYAMHPRSFDYEVLAHAFYWHNRSNQSWHCSFMRSCVCMYVYVCAPLRACVSACVHARVCGSVYACMRSSAFMSVRVWNPRNSCFCIALNNACYKTGLNISAEWVAKESFRQSVTTPVTFLLVFRYSRINSYPLLNHYHHYG